MDKFLELFSTEGRANRSWYFWHILLDDIAIFTAMMVFFVLGVVSPLFIVPGIGVLIAGTWAGICMTVKRLHDLGRPGWHFLLFMIPLYNLYLGLVLLFKKGTEGPNEFGPDPLIGANYLPS
ncbi:MAG: DUF805 domain-containing protein [Gemmatimonadota bacterium]